MPDATFPPFRPHPLLPTGHLQTLAGVYLPWNHVPHSAVEHRVPLEDGDQIVLHDDRPAEWPASQGVCLLMHGLGGCRLSGYMRRIADRLMARGVRVFRMDLRGCGAGEGVAEYSTHCGRWPDAAAAIEYIARQAPGAPLALVGFSLGGTIALNLAAEIGVGRCGDLRALMAVCPPLDLHGVRARFETPGGRPYDRHFANALWRKTRERTAERVALGTLPSRRRPRRIYEYDDWITAPLSGYRSADDYYTRTSPISRIAGIRLPTFILAAKDDPIIPPSPLLSLPKYEGIEIVATERGGHLGYIAARGCDPDSRWMDWRVVDWVTSTLAHTRVRASHGEASAVGNAPLPADG